METNPYEPPLELEPQKVERIPARSCRLGTYLTVINGLSWVLIFAVLHYLPRNVLADMPLDNFIVWPMLILSFPIATCAIFPSCGPPSVEGVVFASTAIGLNTIVWGHGLAWVIESFRGFMRAR